MALNTSYQPVSWNGEPVTTDKLNQMANNTQWLFDRAVRVRYSTPAVTRDVQMKVIAGKTPYTSTAGSPNGVVDNEWITISFGSFFSVGCHPVVTASVEPGGHARRIAVTLSGINDFAEIDWNGFQAIVWDAEIDIANSTIEASGFVHWVAYGY